MEAAVTALLDLLDGGDLSTECRSAVNGGIRRIKAERILAQPIPQPSATEQRSGSWPTSTRGATQQSTSQPS